MTLEEKQSKYYKGFIERRYKLYLMNCYARNYASEITKELFVYLTSKNCYYCNKTPKRYTNSEFVFKYNGLDRKDNNLGYTIKNTVTCCGICNFLKSNLTEKEFYSKLKSIDYDNLKLENYLKLLKDKYFQSISYNDYSKYIVNIINRYSDK